MSTTFAVVYGINSLYKMAFNKMFL